MIATSKGEDCEGSTFEGNNELKKQNNGSEFKTYKLYSEYNVSINMFNNDDNKLNSNDNLFELKFIGINGDNKGRIYYKMFNNNDLNYIKIKIGQPNIKNTKLMETILYCLCKYNHEYSIKYNNNNNALTIYIIIIIFNIIFIIIF